MVVRLGSLSNKFDSGEDFDAIEFITHERYNDKTKENDIAVIKLSRKVSLNRNPDRSDDANTIIRPACLWQSANIDRSETIAIGWGRNESAAIKGSDKLMKVKLDLFDLTKCNYLKEIVDDDLDINDKQICVGFMAGGKDTCQGGE